MTIDLMVLQRKYYKETSVKPVLKENRFDGVTKKILRRNFCETGIERNRFDGVTKKIATKKLM